MSESRDDFFIAIRSALLKKGAKQKFSLFFLLAISFSIFYLDNSSIKYTKSVRALINDGVYRISSATSSPLNFFSFLSNKSKNHFSTYDENIRLKKELELIKTKEFDSQFLLTENTNLKKAIDLTKKENRETILAKVILDKNSPFLKSLIAGKGSKSGVKKGMPVMNGNYLIGKIVEVNYLSSRVLLLNDLNSRIPVIIEPVGVQAILVGYGTTHPILEHLPDKYLPEAGSTIFTSGKDGFFSSGIPIGKTIAKEEYIAVKLLTDPNQALFLQIVLNASEGFERF